MDSDITSPGLRPEDALNSRYEILDKVGSGGMGIVYKARDRETGATVAVKVLHSDIASNPEFIDRFKMELVLARKITHKNVCRVYDLNRADNVVSISMEYVEGESLRAVLDRPQGISIRQGLHIVRQIIAGLAEAHAQGVVHRDLKPENILIDRDGTVKVMDFGIARLLDTGATLTGSIIGTPAYMSPEQAEAQTVDARSDVYSLGLVMYEMFCGQRAFTGDTAIAIAMKQIQEKPPPPAEVEPNLPGFLDRAILKCIEKSPGKRFQSAAELETALTAKLEVAPAPAAKEGAEPSMPLHLTRWQRSDWFLVAGALIGLVLFFPLIQRISFAPRSQVSVDRSVLQRIAQDSAQKLGAPMGQASQIDIVYFPNRYDYVAERAGAPAALELANNPVPYWAWLVDFGNGTTVGLDHRGLFKTFARDFHFPAGQSTEKPAVDEAKALAEKAIVDFFHSDLSALLVETSVSDTWRGNAATSFAWSDPKDYYGIKRRYLVRLVGREIASLESLNAIPPEYVRPDYLWQVLPLIALELVLLVAGLFQRQLVDLHSRWRIITIVLGSVTTGWLCWLTLAAPLRPLGTSSLIFFIVVMCLAAAFLTFFILIPVEWAVRRAGPARLSTLIRLFDRRAASEPCGLSILRGTLVGLALLGADAFLVWVGTTHLGMWADSFTLIYIQGQVFLNNPWPGPLLALYPILQAIIMSVLVCLFASLLTRVMRRSWIVLFLAAVLAAAIFPGPLSTMGAVQPYLSKVLLLFFEFLILAWTFTKFDVLTLFVAAFTAAFCWQNYTLLLMFKPIGSFGEWVAFAAWGLFVAAAAAIAFKSSLLAAYRRVAIAFE